MPTKSKSLMLTVPDDIAAAIDDVKRTNFIDKSYAEMYRYLIRRGLDSLKPDPPSAKNSHIKSENQCASCAGGILKRIG